jgi:hypothetical protein
MSAEKKFNFSEYYNSNPEFRERHKKYMSEKKPCSCGFVTARSNMSKHKKSSNHTKRMAEFENNLEIKFIKKYEDLKKIVDEQKDINKQLKIKIKKMEALLDNL